MFTFFDNNKTRVEVAGEDTLGARVFISVLWRNRDRGARKKKIHFFVAQLGNRGFAAQKKEKKHWHPRFGGDRV